MEKLREIETLSEHKDEIEKANSFITGRLEFLSSLLNGIIKSPTEKGELYFPLLGTVYNSSEIIHYSTIERLKVKISRAKDKDTFVFVPSNHKKETLEEQAKISFELAKSFIGEYKHRLAKHHEVLIYFENRNAEYDGRSLGVALTIGLIEAFSFHYNLPYITHIKSNVVSTGGVCKNGKLQQLGKEVTEKKVEAVFYSAHEILILPKADEQTAADKLEKLKEKYPQRVLRITAVESLEDLLARRNLVDFKKQPKVVRAARAAKKNWIATILFLLLTLILIFIYMRDIDDNPYMYEQTENEILIKNKNGKNLWDIKCPNNIKTFQEAAIESHLRILDVNGDGINEVLFRFDSHNNYVDASITAGLSLLDSKGKVIWLRSFRKLLSSRKESLSPPYNIELFDTLRVNNDLCILCGSNNLNSYASAAYILNLRGNRIVSDTLWNPGHFNDIRIADLDSDGVQELVFLTCNNGLKKTALYHINLDKLNGQVPTTDEYRLYNIKDAKTLQYFLFPNSCYALCDFLVSLRLGGKRKDKKLSHKGTKTPSFTKNNSRNSTHA